eukprot:CAMPEP_0119036466 /NCGR_PEP_ID=MMETSP1177-20130426/4191_1 /TAXON_ID=2985 /ORGANISM="Ochromonas sp, Strain CCMP1899" /LENGTH=495 /DNA_ID=CAMNT_0006996387 /DNA_START=200 /DNA_END=1687 /DNA_ORIENTATION=-
MDGEYEVSDNHLERSVSVKNGFHDKSIEIFWVDPDSYEEYSIDILEPNSEGVLRTFDDHRFHAKEVGNYDVILGQIIIIEGISSYSVGSQETKKIITAADGIIQEDKQHKIQIITDPQVTIIGKRTTAMAAKFRCLCSSIDYYFDDGGEGLFQGSLNLGKETTINTYEGHVFFFTERGNKDSKIGWYRMSKDQSTYVIETVDEPPPQEYQEFRSKEIDFHEEYLNRTGILWRHYYGTEGVGVNGTAGPRPPPILHMWSAEEIGEVHHVTSDEGFWNCFGTPASCQSTDPIDLELHVASIEPRAFLIPQFLSDYETDDIIQLARPLIYDSTVGQTDGGGTRNSDTRTSKNAWVSRESSAVTESLYRRAAHLLNLDEALLNRDTNAEDMQVVHYVNGQKYDAHHDWGVSGYPESRFITLLLYLTDMEDPEAGGETAFPKGADGLGFKVTPKKGSAVLFYNLLEDGNGDDLALHAALPVYRGEKWLANFWVWDPKISE